MEAGHDDNALKAAMGKLFPGTSTGLAVFVLISIILIFLAVVCFGIYFTVRYVRRATGAIVKTAPTGPRVQSTYPTDATSPVSSVSEVKTTTETDIEATAGIEVNGVNELQMLDMLPTPVRKAYLKFVRENTPPSPDSEDTPVYNATSPSRSDRPPTPAPFSRVYIREYSNSHRQAPSTSRMNHPPTFNIPGSTSQDSSFHATSSSSDASSYSLSNEPSLESSPRAHVLQVRNAASPPSVSSASTSSSDSLPILDKTQRTPTPTSKQQRVSTPAGMKPLRLVQKVTAQSPSDLNAGRDNAAHTFSDAELRRSAFTYHDTTVSRIVKIGGGKRHRDARPATLGY